MLLREVFSPKNPRNICVAISFGFTNKIASLPRLVGGTKSYVFYSGGIRTLVAMENYSSHRLIMGKVYICIIFCLDGDIWKKNTEMFIE